MKLTVLKACLARVEDLLLPCSHNLTCAQLLCANVDEATAGIALLQNSSGRKTWGARRSRFASDPYRLVDVEHGIPAATSSSQSSEQTKSTASTTSHCRTGPTASCRVSGSSISRRSPAKVHLPFKRGFAHAVQRSLSGRPVLRHVRFRGAIVLG